MKKILISFLSLSSILFVNAQTGSSDGDYKQYSGAKSLEVQFAPLGGSPISIGGLRFRTFTSSNSAIRLNAFLGINSNTDKRTEVDANGDDVILKDRTSSFTIQLKPGIERHFAGTSRLSPYYGAEGIIGYKSSSVKAETFDTDGSTVISNKTKNPGNDGYFRLGANAILGADYYFSKSIYLGTEVGFGMQFSLKHDAEFVPADGDETILSEGGSTFNFGPNAVGQIRLGFLF